jgi:ankyrin repeat protein
MHVKNGRTHPLFLAAVIGIKDIIVMLHSCELLDLDMRNYHGETALETACGFNNYVAADILLQYGANIYPTHEMEFEEPDPGPLWLAAATGNAKLVSRLLTASATSAVPQTEYPLSSTALHIAVKGGFKDVAAILLQSGLDIEAKCAFSGFYIYGGLRLPVYTRLLRSIDCAESQGPPSSSWVNERVSIIEELQSIFENNEESALPYLVPSSVGYIPLFEAVLYRRMEMVEFLLDQKADINATSILRDTPLIAAIESESLRMVRALIKRSADTEFRCQCKGTCLMVAAGTGYEKMVLIFLEQLTKVEKMTSWGQELGAAIVATVIGQMVGEDEQKMCIRDEQADPSRTITQTIYLKEPKVTILRKELGSYDYC